MPSIGETSALKSKQCTLCGSPQQWKKAYPRFLADKHVPKKTTPPTSVLRPAKLRLHGVSVVVSKQPTPLWTARNPALPSYSLAGMTKPP